MYTIGILVLEMMCCVSVQWSEAAKVNLTADRLLLLELENKYLNVFQASNCPMRRTTRSEKDIMESLDRCIDSDELLDKMITKVQDALERVVAFIKIHGSSTTLSRMQLRRLQKYRNQLHGDNFISVFTCPICSIKSITFIGLWKHMSGLHNIYLRAKGMLSTVIARDAFITPRKLILRRRVTLDPLIDNATAPAQGMTEKARRVLKKIRRRKKVVIEVTTVPLERPSFLTDYGAGAENSLSDYQDDLDPRERREWNSLNRSGYSSLNSENIKAQKRLNRIR